MAAAPEPHDGAPPAFTDDEVAALVDRLLAIARTEPDEESTAESAELEAAHEELRVAAEEMRVQQAQIQQLVGQYALERRWRSQLSALLPVGLCTTDGDGKVLEANPALATELGLPLARLRGKPLGVYLAGEDLQNFRSALRGLALGEVGEHRATVRVQGRGVHRTVADLFGFADVVAPRHGDARIQWVLLPRPSAEGVSAGAEQPVPPVGLAAALAELSTLPLHEDDRQRLLGRIATLTRGAVPSAAWVSVTLGSPAHPQQLASDSPEAQEFDGMQMQTQEGPCWEAFASGRTVLTGDVATDPRWPHLTALAGGAAVRSVLALPVQERGETTGVLNVYASRSHAFGDDGRRFGEVVAAAVTGVLQGVGEREALKQLVANLEVALTSRAVIDQAKGMLMGRLGVDADEAFRRLVKLSSRLNIKLRELARLMVEGHADEVVAALRN